MFKSLKQKLPLLFVFVSLISVLIVSIITNITIQRQFNTYVLQNQDKRNASIIESLSRIYVSYGGWNNSAVTEIKNSGTFGDINLTVRDENKYPIFRVNSINGMMMRHMRMMNRASEYMEKSFPIEVDNSIVGYADIGYFGSVSLSLLDLSFIDSINSSILTAAIISAAVALILSLIIARGLSRPLLKLTEVANSIKAGNLKTRFEGSSNNSEVEELSSAINSLAESLDEQEGIRKRMTSDIAHELRTPLTTLKSHIEAIMDGVWEMTPERLNGCYEEVIRLSRLIKDLEQLNRLESSIPPVQKSYFDLNELISGLVESFSPQYMEKHITLSFVCDDKLNIVADRDKTSQVIVNLLSNAFKYTESEGKVEVCAYKDDHNAYIKVSDTGMGIPKEDLPHIFDRFYRGDKSRSRDTGGTGIGLTITKALVEAHGGSIKVKSEPNVGSEFIVSLPQKF